jgi:hypothetical protein
LWLLRAENHSSAVATGSWGDAVGAVDPVVAVVADGTGVP